MALGLSLLSGLMVLFMFRLAAAGQPLHHEFADKAAAIDGEMVDVISNMSLVRAFGGRRREHRRFDGVVDLELTARRRSLRYLEKLRLIHASFTILLTIGLLAWAIVLWQRGPATTGDVILACTLGLTILHATRDLAVALVDATQHLARLAEALPTLLVPHDMPDHPEAKPLVPAGAKLTFERVSFRYPDGHGVFRNFNLEVEPGQRVGLIGQSGAGKSTLFALMQRVLRDAGRAHPDRRSGHCSHHPGQPSRVDCGRAAGRVAVPAQRHGEHPLWPSRCKRRHGSCRGARRAL